MTPQAPWEHLVCSEQIVALHDRALSETHGSSGPPREGCVEGSLGAAWNAEIYAPADENPANCSGYLFACYLIFYLVGNHCFPDGNKRAALLGAQCALGALGLTIDARPEEIAEFLTELADNPHRKRDDVVAWVTPRLVELE